MRQLKTNCLCFSTEGYGLQNRAVESKVTGLKLVKNGEPRLPINELLQAIDFTEFIVKISKRISAEDNQNAAEMYSKGMSLREISKQLGMSKNGVRSSLLRAGHKLREPAPKATHMRSLKSGKQSALPYYGFCYFEGKIVKDPREFPILQRIHRLWSQGRTIHQINLELNRAKLPSRKGRAWSWAAIQNIVARFENKQVVLLAGGKYEFR